MKTKKYQYAASDKFEVCRFPGTCERAVAGSFEFADGKKLRVYLTAADIEEITRLLLQAHDGG